MLGKYTLEVEFISFSKLCQSQFDPLGSIAARVKKKMILVDSMRALQL